MSVNTGISMGESTDQETARTLDALRRIGASGTVVRAFDALARERARIQKEQYRPERERVEIGAAMERTRAALSAEVDDVEATAKAERDRDLAAIDQQLANANRLPVKGLATAHHEYLEALALRQIEDVRTLGAITAAAADVQLALATDDAGTLEQLAAEALEHGHPEQVRRVARTVELRLATLARAEMARDDGQPRPAAAAAVRVAEQLRAWRAAEADRSPAVRRQRVVARYEQRVGDARTIVEQAARAFNLTFDATRP